MARLRPLSRTAFFFSSSSPCHKRFKKVHVASRSLREKFRIPLPEDLNLLRTPLLSADREAILHVAADLAGGDGIWDIL